MFRISSSTRRTVLPASAVSCSTTVWSILRWGAPRPVDGRWRKSDTASTMRSGKVAPCVNNDRELKESDLRFNPFDQFEATYIRQLEIEYQAVERPGLEDLKSPGRGACCLCFDVVSREEFNEVISFDFGILHDKKVFLSPVKEGLDLEHRPNEILPFNGLPEVGKGSQSEGTLRGIAPREDLDGNVTKFDIMLEVIKERPPFHVRQPKIERNRLRSKFSHHRKSG